MWDNEITDDDHIETEVREEARDLDDEDKDDDEGN